MRGSREYHRLQVLTLLMLPVLLVQSSFGAERECSRTGTQDLQKRSQRIEYLSMTAFTAGLGTLILSHYFPERLNASAIPVSTLALGASFLGFAKHDSLDEQIALCLKQQVELSRIEKPSLPKVEDPARREVAESSSRENGPTAPPAL